MCCGLRQSTTGSRPGSAPGACFSTPASLRRIVSSSSVGVFGTAQSLPTGATPTYVAVADFNTDGKLDLLSTNGDGTISVLLGAGSGTFKPAISLANTTGYHVVAASRHAPGGRMLGGPWLKKTLSRLAGLSLYWLRGLPTCDATNAFKLYRREVIEGIQPLISPHFNLTVEMPLKAIIRGYSFAVGPISWTNRQTGISKLKIKEMGSRYLFIVLYLWLEKHLARGDYHRQYSTEQHQAGLNMHHV